MAGRRPANPPRHVDGFVLITHVRCPDCEYNGYLNNQGRPIVVEGGALRGASRDVGLVTMAHGCPTCEGTGSIPVDPLSPESIDPYARKVAVV